MHDLVIRGGTVVEGSGGPARYADIAPMVALVESGLRAGALAYDHLPADGGTHRQTRQTAELYGLADRGLLAPGMRADLNVVDYEGLGVHAPEIVHDLPSGELPGRLVRGPQG